MLARPLFSRYVSRRSTLWVAFIVLVLATLACDGSGTGNTANSGSDATDVPAGPTATVDLSFIETFDSNGNWVQDSNKDANVGASNGVYAFTVSSPNQSFWATADRLVGSGTYEVKTTAVSGPVNNGYGMMIDVQDSTDTFYALEISSDGYVAIYQCENACDTLNYIVSDGWFQSSAIRQGLNETNVLKIEAPSFGTMRFFVNEQLVGEYEHNDLILGDIAVLVDTFDEGNVTVHFDDFKFTP